MRYHDRMSVGDKVSSNANKNIIMKVISDNDMSYSEFRPMEKVDSMQSAGAVDGRKITSIFKIGAINKCMIELYRSCCEIYNKPWKALHEICEELK